VKAWAKAARSVLLLLPRLLCRASAQPPGASQRCSRQSSAQRGGERRAGRSGSRSAALAARRGGGTGSAYRWLLLLRRAS
jgi:hypothetical protein